MNMADDDGPTGTWRTVIGIAEIIVGGAIAYRGYQKAAYGTPGFLGSQRPGLSGRGNLRGIINTAKTVVVRSIDERVAYIQEKASKGSLHPAIKELTAKVLSQKCGDKWCLREKDYIGEIKALFWALKDVRSPHAMRYQRDHAYVDQFVAADKLLKLQSGDCDDDAILLGAMLLSAGYPTKMRIVAANGKDDDAWSHIYLRAGIPPGNPTRWVPLDLTVNKGPDWEVPGAQDSLESGSPAGLVTRTRDYDVWNPRSLKR
jgi:hypothetical protein